MPRQPRFSKEDIVAAGLRIARASGYDAVSARALGKELGMRLVSYARNEANLFQMLFLGNKSRPEIAEKIARECLTHARQGSRRHNAQTHERLYFGLDEQQEYGTFLFTIPFYLVFKRCRIICSDGYGKLPMTWPVSVTDAPSFAPYLGAVSDTELKGLMMNSYKVTGFCK